MVLTFYMCILSFYLPLLLSVFNCSSSECEGASISQTQQHVGAVRALDINPFQSNLLASGASESEIFIWDLNNPSSAMSPGNKIHPLEDISCLAWNRQVSVFFLFTFLFYVCLLVAGAAHSCLYVTKRPLCCVGPT